jgi:NAD(P)-dependent dehydrogenase (short-subunit alcohol dehydrogenase family)
MSRDNRLSEHVALVTGANRDGIGRAIVRRLAAHGASVVLHGSGRGSEGLEESKSLIQAAGGKAACIEADLQDGEARADLLARAGEIFGPADILVNNAGGITAYAPPSRIDYPARLATFEVNFQAPVDLTQQALPAMRVKGWGRIINITSDSVNQFPPPYMGPPKFIHALTLYGAAKKALDRYTLGLAAELHGTGITVNGTKPYAVAWSGGADQLARQMLQVNPHLVESLELLAETAFLLVTKDVTGLVLNSREILQLFQAPLHDLAGDAVIGDALTIPAHQTAG